KITRKNVFCQEFEMTKRPLEDIDSAIKLKTLKLDDNYEPKEDSIFVSSSLTADVSASLVFDYVLSKFVIELRKNKNERETSVCLSERNIQGLIDKLPMAIKIAEKYQQRQSSRSLDIPFEIPGEGTNEMTLMMSVKENNFGKTRKFQIDIRKCSMIGDSIRYTKDGVRVDLDEANLVFDELKKYIEKIRGAVKNSQQLLNTAYCLLAVQMIEVIHQGTECNGCATEHPSQREHMGTGGCMLEWSDKVQLSWFTVQAMIEAPRVVAVCQSASSRLPSVNRNSIPITTKVDETNQRMK
ncbi:hypothetical protein MAR_038270, partial [Mya arenaria]